jgi:hypothetical protein
MTKLFLLLCAAILFSTLARAQTPVCGLNGTQAPIIPGTQDGGGQDWTTFAAPALGGAYTDGLGTASGGKGGCQITRVSQIGSSSVGVVYDSETGVFSQDDKMLVLMNYIGGSKMIVSTPADTAHTPGTPVLTSAQMPSMNGNLVIWSYTQANQFYYTNGTSILLATVNGLPGCIATTTCSTTSTTVTSFASSGGSTGAGYTSVIFPDKYDGFPGFLAFLGRNASGTMDLDVWNLNTSTNVVWYTTTCTTTNPLGSQPGCIHGILQFPDGTAMIGYGGSDGSHSGNTWFHGSPGSATATQLQASTCHNAVGLDMSGTEKWIVCRQMNSGGIEACPSGQWTGASGGGQDLINLTDPKNLSSTAICSLNINWEAQEFSWHGRQGTTQPYYLTSFWDANRTGGSAEYFSTSGGYNASMVTCTQTNTTTSGGCWVPYQDELVLTRTDNNFNSVCNTSPCFQTVWRLGWARSRSNENFWTIPNASISRDGNYIAFNSNMAYPAGTCSSTYKSNGGCSEAYVLSGPSGTPLLGSSVTLEPPPVLTGTLQ